MSKSFKVPFAFDDKGNVIDVSSGIKGVDYQCNCGSIVKLRGGEIISNHFYHVNGSACSLESAIHKAYKSVFKKIQKIKLPYKINGDIYLEFDRVELEKKIDCYIPDAIGYIGETRYLIEFAKSSYIGKRKEAAIKKSNLFCLEVDIIKTITSIEDITNHLLKEKGFKHIIHIPEYKEMRELRENFKREYRKLQAKNSKRVEDLKDEIDILRRKVEVFNELMEEGALFYQMDCKNGAKMYQRNLKWGREVVAFQNGKVLNLRFSV